MFNRHNAVENPPELAEPVDPTPPRERKPAHEAECFKPSSFAIRKAEADARNAKLAQPRIMSMGMSSQWFKDNRGKDVWVECELFCDRDHPTRKWVSIPGQPGLMPLHDDSRRDPKPEQLGTISRSSKPGQIHPPSLPDEGARPV